MERKLGRRAPKQVPGHPPRGLRGRVRSVLRRRREQELEDRLARAEARYRALTEQLPIVTYVTAVDVQGSFTYISPQVEALLGFKPEEWLRDRRLWLKRLHPQDRQRLLPLLSKADRATDRFKAEYRLLGRDGRPRWVRDESRAVRASDGKIISLQGTWTEITRRKELEEEAISADRRLASSRFDNEQFVAAASHELNGPLRRIANLSELLAARARGALDADAQALLARIRDSASLMRELIAGLAAYSELDHAQAELSSVDLEGALDGALEDVVRAVQSAGAEITRGPMPRALAEPALLRTVLRNLLENAVKFRGDAAPRVHVSAHRTGGAWVVSVRDHGIGIGPKQAERVFSLFARLNGDQRYAGTGLGLAVCRKIVERFGGRIWAESELGEGSIFRFTLRAADQENAP